MNFDYLSNDKNTFTKAEKNATISVEKESQRNAYPKLNEVQKTNIKSAKHTMESGIISDKQYQDNLKLNGVDITDKKLEISLTKLPKEKLELTRLRKLTGEYDLNTISPKKLQEIMVLKKKTPDDYYSNVSNINEEKKRLDEAFGPKTDFSIFNFENNYDKFNQEEKEMFTHKMQLKFNNLGYTDKGGFKLKTDGILGNKTKSVYEQYKKDNNDDYTEAITARTIATIPNQSEVSALKEPPKTNIANSNNEEISPVLYSNQNDKQDKKLSLNKPTSIRKWLTENSRTPQNGKLYNKDTTLCINGQSVNPDVKNLKYGSKNISFNGCELIAVYNALLLTENQQDFKDIIDKAEKTDKLLWLNGLWGSNPNYLDKLLDKYNQEYKKIKDSNYNKYLKEGGTYILSFWNSHSIFDGIHTVTFTSDANKNIVVYNRYSNVSKPYIYNSTNEKTGLDLLMEECGMGIVMYEIKK